MFVEEMGKPLPYFLLAASISAVLIIYIYDVQNIAELLFYLRKNEHAKNPLDGCVHVYLDMGTNNGHQIRLGF